MVIGEGKLKKLVTTVTLVLIMTLVGCVETLKTPKNIQEDLSKEAAANLTFTENAERDNIVKRLTQTGDPGRITYILLLSHTGKGIHYVTVKGKITSSGKRLTPVDRVTKSSNLNGVSWNIRKSASDEGTYGSSTSYIYFWDTNGVYWQWNTLYILSDNPFRLSEPTLIKQDDYNGETS